MALKWPAKDPEEVLDYPVQFDDWLVEGCDLVESPLPTVEIETIEPSESPESLNIDDIQVAGKAIIVWLSGGTAGTTYTLKITANDTGPKVRTVVRRVKIKITEK